MYHQKFQQPRQLNLVGEMCNVLVTINIVVLCHPSDNSLNEMIETLTELSCTVKQMATLKLKELEDRLEKTAKFEQDIHEITKWLSNKQEELSNAGSVRGIPDGIKEQLAHHMVKLMFMLL